MITGWRYYYHRYLGWLPVQFCLACGKPYWGGLPRFWFLRRAFRLNGERYLEFKLHCTWQASWMDYCSSECNDEGHKLDDAMMGIERKS